MCKAVTLKSDSFHLAIVFYFPLYLFFALFEIQTLERPSKALLPCNAQQSIFKLFQTSFKLNLSIFTKLSQQDKYYIGCQYFISFTKHKARTNIQYYTKPVSDHLMRSGQLCAHVTASLTRLIFLVKGHI